MPLGCQMPGLLLIFLNSTSDVVNNALYACCQLAACGWIVFRFRCH